jgi:hypothetical protein
MNEMKGTKRNSTQRRNGGSSPGESFLKKTKRKEMRKKEA